MSKETKAKGLDTLTVRLPLPLAQVLREWKGKSGVSIQHFVTTIIAAELAVNPHTGKPLPKAKGEKA